MNKITLLGILELTAMVFKRVDEKQKLEYNSLEEGNSNYSYEIDSPWSLSRYESGWE